MSLLGPAPPPPLRRVALGLSYDGSGFHGFAAQPGQRTVAGLLQEALGRLAGRPVQLVCAGRTDAGVHALAQVVHADLETDLLAARFGAPAAPAAPAVLRSPGAAPGGPLEELPALARAIDRQVGPELACWRAVLAPEGFDARRSAIARRYHYDLDCSPRPDPRRRASAWRLPGPPDLSLLRLAADPLLGEHDFAAFCRRPPDRPTGPITRRVTAARWCQLEGGLLRFQIEATAFCHQMVRSLVGTLVAVGTGRLRPSDVVALLRSGERAGTPTLAPPEGLCLVAVSYPEGLGGTWGEPARRPPGPSTGPATGWV